MASTEFLGLAFIKDQWRYIEEMRPIRRGKHQGQIMVKLIGGSAWKRVDSDAISRTPSTQNQLRLFDS